MPHEFAKSLAWSNEFVDAPWWLDVYRKAFPNLESAVSVRDDGWAQRGGIDRVITLDSGKTLGVDEKVRKEDWPDFCLEYWSDKDRKTRGWIAKDLACDYIAYAFVPSQTCYLLPFQTLRQAWRQNCKRWTRDHKKISAKNVGYTTVSVAVPINVVMTAMQNAMRIQW